MLSALIFQNVSPFQATTLAVPAFAMPIAAWHAILNFRRTQTCTLAAITHSTERALP